jgi:phospholipid/cholesterol/gamma-HCH transport system substrate-binding protein
MKRERDPRFRYLEAIVGAFIIAALVAIASAIVFTGIEHDLFAEKYHLRFRTDSGTGFAQGMPVKLSGFRIGRVRTLSLDEQARVIVRMQIEKKYQKWIRTDSFATLLKEGLVGDTVVALSVGSPDRPALSNDDFLPFKEEKGLSELALEFSDSVKTVLFEVRKTVAYINDPGGDIKQTLGNIRRLSANLEQTRRNVDTLLAATTDNVGRFGPAIDNLSAGIDNVLRKLPPLIERTEGTLANAEAVSLEIRKATEKGAPRIPPLIGGTEDLVGEANAVVKGIKTMWPFKNHIPPAGEQRIVPGDSHE